MLSGEWFVAQQFPSQRPNFIYFSCFAFNFEHLNYVTERQIERDFIRA